MSCNGINTTRKYVIKDAIHEPNESIFLHNRCSITYLTVHVRKLMDTLNFDTIQFKRRYPHMML